MSDGHRLRRVLVVLRNLRGPALFVLGPAVGVCLAATIFGLPRNLQLAAVVMFGFSLGLYGILARAEWREVARRPGVGHRDGPS